MKFGSRNYNAIIRVITSIFIVSMFSVCAKNVFPPGGPEDKTPPEIIEVFPPPNSINVSTNTEIKISFSEDINRKDITDGIFISPIFEQQPKFSWKGKTLKIKSKTPLRKDHTYVVTTGTDISDLHGNRLKHSFIFAFSTGSHIDKGAISGKGYLGDKSVKGLGIWAYALSESTSADPAYNSPDYIMLTGDGGSYRLDYLAPGDYRLFAVNDKNKDKLWDTDSEEYGTAFDDFTIDDSNYFYSDINLTAVKIDTMAPLISSCEMLPGGVLKVNFESDIDVKQATDLSFYKFTSEIGTSPPFDPISIYSLPNDKRSIFIRGGISAESAVCSLTVKNINSEFGVAIDTTDNNCIFITSDKPDTTGPKIIYTKPATNSKVFPPDSAIVLSFSEPVLTDSVEAGIVLSDTLGDTINGDFYWQNDIAVRFKPQSLKGQTFYILSLDPSRTMDIFYNPMADTLWELHFETMPSDTGGTASGEIICKDSIPVVIRFLPIKRGIPLTYYSPSGGDFSFNGIPGGKYLAYAFLDRNNDGEYYTGGYRPFKYSEQRLFFPDTVAIRPRWETTGIRFEFK